MRIKETEADARQEGKDIPTAEAEIRIGSKQRIREQSRRIIIGINRLRCQVIGRNGPVRGQRESDKLIDTNSGARQSSIKARYGASGVSFLRGIDHRGLLEAATQFPVAHDFKSVVYTD